MLKPPEQASGAAPIASSRDDWLALAARATRHETPCGNGVVVWHVWGDDAADPVVLLHGGSGSWNHWVRNVDALVRGGFRVLAPDLPGFGESDITPEGFDADAQFPWIALGMERLLGAAPCHTVAFSFGCMVAAFIAAQAPARVRHLVLVGAPALTLKRRPSLKLKPWRDLPLGPEREEAQAHNLGAIMLHRPQTQPAVAAELHALNLERDRIPHRRLFQTDIVAQQLPSIEAPLWAIWGSADALHVGRLESYMPVLETAPRFQSMTVLAHSGHWVQFEASASFNRVLLAILRAEAL